MTEDNELEYLRFFYATADFGPAHEDVVYIINNQYEEEHSKEVPEAYRLD